MDHHPGAVDVADLEVESFGEAESQGVDSLEVDAVVWRTDGGDELTDLVDGEDVGESLLAGGAESLEGGPVARTGVRIEEFDTTIGDAEGSGGEVAVVLEVEEVVAELGFGEAIGGGVEVVGELSDGAEVGVLGAIAEPGELEVLAHALTESRVHERGPFAVEEEMATEKDPGPRRRGVRRRDGIGEDGCDRNGPLR
jgi:hypothetical protein